MKEGLLIGGGFYAPSTERSKSIENAFLNQLLVSNTIPKMDYRIVLDTNVIVSALRSSQGASFKLLSLAGQGKFEFSVSVPLIFEYEDACNRQGGVLQPREIGDIIDYLCQVGDRRQIYFLWRPCLKDPKDDLVLELAVESGSDFIVTYNQRDFAASEKFGVRILTPKEFLTLIGECS